MSGSIRGRVFVTFPLVLAGLSLGVFSPAASATTTDKRSNREQSVAVALSYQSPAKPLDGGVGVSARYARALPWGRRKPGAPRRFRFEAGLGRTTLDRGASGLTQSGELTLTSLAAGVGGSLGPPVGAWSFSLGAGLDYLIASAAGRCSSPPSTGLTNRYDAKSGLGFHVGFEAARPIGPRWLFFAELRYLEAKLDGTHRFVLSGVAGEPTSVTFDLNGPQVNAGAAWRF